MKGQFKEIFGFVLLMLIIFSFSFCDFNGVFFVLSIPILIALLSKKLSYFIYGCMVMFLASFIINAEVLPLALIFAYSISLLIAVIINKFNIPLKVKLSILGASMGLVVSLVMYFNASSTSIINVFLVPAITYFLCYGAVDVEVGLKSREQFSLTIKQLMFLVFTFGVVAFNLGITIGSFSLNFVLVVLLCYIVMRVDATSGTLAYLASILFLGQSLNNETIIFMLIPLILSLRAFYKTKYFGALLYGLTNVLFVLYFKNFDFLPEAIVISFVVLLIPEKSINFINKFIIEPKDYELKLYQQSYYRCLNRNKKIQKVMLTLEEQIQNNSKLKKNSKNLFIQNMQFLSDKLKEEENIHFKNDILRELEIGGNTVVALKIISDYLNHYKISLEVQTEEENVEKIISVLQDNLEIKVKLEERYYNPLIRTISYVFVNGEEQSFNFYISQRSKEASSCGDSYLTFETKNKKYFLMSDGMGHGKNASKNSSTAILLLKNFIELGMNPDKAILSCNALIYDKENEKFNTLDLLEYDSLENKACLYKNGSGVTYVKSTSGIEMFSSENLPLGIVETIEVKKLTISVDQGFIVLTSDGIRKDLGELLKNTNATNSKDLAMEIFDYEGKNIDDDQTIVVINVIKNV